MKPGALSATIAHFEVKKNRSEAKRLHSKEVIIWIVVRKKVCWLRQHT